MSTKVIISRYDENLNWLAEFKDLNILVYNKGNLLEGNKIYKIIDLPNVGRESHTWIHHIVENYENLDDINIFLQGCIDDLGCISFKNIYYYSKYINQFGFCASRYGLLGPLHWSHNIGIEKNKKYKEAWFNNEISKSSLGFRGFSKSLFPEIPIFVATSYGGCFSVKKELIRKHSKKFYENILNSLKKNKNPIEGHYMERLWCYLFTKNKILPRSIKDVFITKMERILN